MAAIVSPPNPEVPSPTIEQVRARLAQEVEKMINAGHLRPGYYNSGLFTYNASWDCGYNNSYSLGDYWYNPADTFYVLIRALPYLPNDLYIQTTTYLQSEFASYSPYQVTYVGWNTGAAREVFDLPPEVVSDMVNYPPRLGDIGFEGWYYNPFGFYAMWQYANVFGGSQAIYNASSSLLNHTPPIDSYLTVHVEVLNSYITGYDGYLKLEALAGHALSTDIQAQLVRLLNLRAATFTKDTPDTKPSDDMNYCRGLNISRNFFYLTPELGQQLHDLALDRVQGAVDEYTMSAPYWFVSSFDATYGEGVNNPLYDYHSLFQAKALILKEPWEELAKYIDEPAVVIGDLYYIDNLISAIESASK
jgi:hypothetical protein